MALAPRPARVLLLGSVLLAAVCGFVYELVIVALGTFLLGNSIVQVSIVLAAFVSAMGFGSLLAKPLLRRPVTWFVAVEGAVALVGGLSALTLYVAYAWLDVYGPATVLVAALIGLLVGLELPLLMTLLQRVSPSAPGTSVADLLAADYLGAMVAGVAFPLLLLPTLGQIDAALAVGALNVVSGLLIAWLLGATEPGRLPRGRLALPLVGVLAVLGVAAAFAGRIETSARQSLFDDPIVLTERTPYQEIVMTRSLTGGDLRLFLNGDLQFSSKDERRYHEALVHPAMAGAHGRVLILGGGDGLALREVLRYRDVTSATLVELDGEMLRLASEDRSLTALNAGAMHDPRVRLVQADAFRWVGGTEARFDVVIADFPDPDDAALARLYSQELYGGIMRRVLSPGGRLVVQSGSPYFARDAFWSIRATVEAAGLATRPYHVDVPSFGDWGYVLARRRAEGRPGLALDPPAGWRPSFLTPAVLAASATFAPDEGPVVDPQVTTLDRPRIVDLERRGYQDY